MENSIAECLLLKFRIKFYISKYFSEQARIYFYYSFCLYGCCFCFPVTQDLIVHILIVLSHRIFILSQFQRNQSKIILFYLSNCFNSPYDFSLIQHRVNFFQSISQYNERLCYTAYIV